MEAQTPRTDGDGETRILRGRDHTMASAESPSASVPPSQTGLSRATGSDGASTSFGGVEEIGKENQQITLAVVGDICPSCGSGALVYEEGCSKCHACGHSEC